MIDLDPNDITCIYSTMLYVSEHARKYGSTPILTFDQPLWLKALNLQESSPTNSTLRAIILRLGGFHTQMNYLGAIGNIMSGSGLQEVLESVYASNAVTHMLSGKAVSRAVRGHFLVARALYSLLLSQGFGTILPNTTGITELKKTNSESTENNECNLSDNIMYKLFWIP
jgi:hypothetical protein